MISMIQYDQTHSLAEKAIDNPLKLKFEPHQKYWMNIEFGKLDMSRTKNLISFLHLPETIVKDIEAMKTLTESKSKEIELPRFYVEKGFSFFHANMISLKPKTDDSKKPKESYYLSDRDLDIEHICIVAKENFLLTFQQGNIQGDVLNPVRYIIKDNLRSIRNHPIHHLFYEIMDTILKQYFLIISEIRNHIEDLESKLFEDDHLGDHDDKLLKEIMGMKSIIRVIRRYSAPLKTALEDIKREESSFSVKDPTKIYYEIVFDKVAELIAYCDHSNDLFKDLMDLHLSLAGAQMNKIMKTLTLLSAIFIPLTFIAGVYGMNFEHMPELRWQYGYLLIWLIMLSISLIIWKLISYKKWI
jgi:magnesium transporter